MKKHLLTFARFLTLGVIPIAFGSLAWGWYGFVSLLVVTGGLLWLDSRTSSKIAYYLSILISSVIMAVVAFQFALPFATATFGGWLYFLGFGAIQVWLFNSH